MKRYFFFISQRVDAVLKNGEFGFTLFYVMRKAEMKELAAVFVRFNIERKQKDLYLTYTRYIANNYASSMRARKFFKYLMYTIYIIVENSCCFAVNCAILFQTKCISNVCLNPSDLYVYYN